MTFPFCTGCRSLPLISIFQFPSSTSTDIPLAPGFQQHRSTHLGRTEMLERKRIHSLGTITYPTYERGGKPHLPSYLTKGGYGDMGSFPGGYPALKVLISVA